MAYKSCGCREGEACDHLFISGPRGEAVPIARGFETIGCGEAVPIARGFETIGCGEAIAALEKGSALSSQEGGDHYKKLKIQPIEYIHANGIPFAEGCVIKYVSRWRNKNGVDDLKKAKHFLELLIELEEKVVDKVV